eukprot:CAMPEP_0181246812 /NCGR_PEP_ID=MMETSP1096-20121128/44225_1 /TAXON_ID=156174 ORGANISM="Chrysochromulina ericina, Strain CCMP281" /NCGR_SAMPLE_ID=MMETSP1096 /ASSEMBLY_ACC=CAM_ASM_000453 /LENGTH=43 /DNA_ID= /DNA_START= /DNA_END= /DNA_ORIENTATION=
MDAAPAAEMAGSHHARALPPRRRDWPPQLSSMWLLDSPAVAEA